MMQENWGAVLDCKPLKSRICDKGLSLAILEELLEVWFRRTLLKVSNYIGIIPFA